MKKLNQRKLIASAVALAPFLSTSAMAQLTIEEILVTAQKRTEKLTDVPISIAAMGGEDIAKTGIRELQEMDEYIPNLEISKDSSYSTIISIRGVGSSSRNIGFDSRVGVYVDGIYMGQSPATNQDILDLERIEVLRGPQGTLFGKNTVAGAISMISKKPNEELSGKVSVDIGNMNSRRYTVMVNVPINDSNFVKLSVNSQERDGYVENLPTGADLGEQDGISFRLQYRSVLTDSLEMNLAVDSLDSKRLIFTGSSYATDNKGIIGTKEFTALNNFEPNEEREIEGVSATFDWQLGSGYSVKSITGYRDTHSYFESDLDGGVPYLGPAASFFGIDNEVENKYLDEYEQLTQEFQLISPSGERFQYVAGMYFYEQEAYTERDAVSHHDPEHPYYAANVYPGPDSYTLRTHGTVDTQSYAVFLNGTYDLTDDLILGFGARYSDEKKDVDWTSDPSGSADRIFDAPGPFDNLNQIFGFADATLKESETYNHFSPEMSLSYHINDELNTYYRVSTGFKSGGYNLDFITRAQYELGLDFDKETVVSHEIGLKGELYDRRLTFNLALFSASYDDYQVQQFIESSGSVAGAAVIRNASEVDTNGVEIEMTALLADNFRLTAAAGYLDAGFADFPGGGKDAVGEPVNLKGNTLAGAPDKTFNIGLEYYLPVPTFDAEVLFRLDYAYAGERFVGTNTKEEKTREMANGDVIDYSYVEDSTRVNARIGLSSISDTWSVALWGRNLTNEDDGTNAENIFGTYRQTHTLPRTYGLEVDYKF